MGTDVLGQHIRTKLDCLTIEEGTAMLSQKSATNYQPTLRNLLQEQRPQLHGREKVKCRRPYGKKKVAYVNVLHFIIQLIHSIKQSVVYFKTCVKIFLKNNSDMFRITQNPSSWSDDST
jgi:hypothetical protein